MTTRPSIPLAMALALCLAVTSVVSAFLMAPDRSSGAREALAQVYGEVAGDLCGDHAGHDAHEHDCPFCHALPYPPQLTAPDMRLAFQPHDLWRQGEALRRAAQARNISHSTRAPPRSA